MKCPHALVRPLPGRRMGFVDLRKLRDVSIGNMLARTTAEEAVRPSDGYGQRL